jgi:capsular polysaccharide biosynthesis protein
MTLQDAVHILRTRWITVVVVTVAATIIAVAYALLATRTYMGSTSIFIATPGSTNTQDAYAGSELAQARTVAYTDLIKSESLTTRTVRRLDLSIAPRDLAKKVVASANTNSVVITLSVTDPSPTNAVSLANDLSDDFVHMVQDLETPAAGGPPAASAVIVEPAVDSQKVSPQRQKIVSFGFNAGLMLGAVVALLRGRPKSEIEAAQHDSLAQARSPDLLQDGAGGATEAVAAPDGERDTHTYEQK